MFIAGARAPRYHAHTCARCAARGSLLYRALPREKRFVCFAAHFTARRAAGAAVRAGAGERATGRRTMRRAWATWHHLSRVPGVWARHDPSSRLPSSISLHQHRACHSIASPARTALSSTMFGVVETASAFRSLSDSTQAGS